MCIYNAKAEVPLSGNSLTWLQVAQKRPFDITTLLHIDGACPPLTAPDDGTIDCSLGDDGFATEGGSCSFACGGTFVLRGSSSRACQNDVTWDGTEVDCLSELYMWHKHNT